MLRKDQRRPYVFTLDWPLGSVEIWISIEGLLRHREGDRNLFHVCVIFFFFAFVCLFTLALGIQGKLCHNMSWKKLKDIDFSDNTQQGIKSLKDYLNEETTIPSTMKKAAALREGAESDFHSYHIITLKCPNFNNKKLQGIQETGKCGLFKEYV